MSPLLNPTFRWLFLAQLFSLAGTGLATVALALMAHDLAGGEGAGAVLGSALAIKMVAYLGVAPVVGGLVDRLPRRAWLIGLDLGRMLVVLALPLVDTVGGMVLMVFLLNLLAAGFTPVYQAAIPDVLTEEAQYTRALGWSRTAVEMESLLSPMFAALLLGFFHYDRLFQLNALTFLLSAMCLWAAVVPAAARSQRQHGIWHNVRFGVMAYLKTPRLRGLLALHGVVCLAGSMVIVNTVVYVREVLGLSEQAVPLFMLASGAGAVCVAMLIPSLLQRLTDRQLMLGGAALMIIGLFLGAALGLLDQATALSVLMIWFAVGAGMSLVLTPSGRLLRVSSSDSDRTAYFSANFALSHGLWLLAYLSSGLLGFFFGLNAVFALHGAMALACAWVAVRYWPVSDPLELWHDHEALEHDHFHEHDLHHEHGPEHDAAHSHAHRHEPMRHCHAFVIDEHHRHWPKSAE